MSRKKFREFYEDGYVVNEQEEERQYKPKDKKRYDSKKRKIQRARRKKKDYKNSFWMNKR